MQEFLNQLIGTFTSFGFRLISAIIVLLVGWFLINSVLKAFGKSKRAEKIDPLAKKFIISFMNAGLKILLLIIVINILGVDMTPVVAVLTSCALAIGLALQGGLSNIAGGLIILLFHPFRAGDCIETDGVLGTVNEVNMFYTILTTPDNRRVTVPNATVSNAKIINLSHEKLRRVDFEFLVPIGTDVDKAQQVLIQVAKANEMVLEAPDCMAAVSGYTENGVKIVLRVWCENANYWPVFFSINENVKEGFAACKIKFARPQLDIHVAGN